MTVERKDQMSHVPKIMILTRTSNKIKFGLSDAQPGKTSTAAFLSMHALSTEEKIKVGFYIKQRLLHMIVQ